MAVVKLLLLLLLLGTSTGSLLDLVVRSYSPDFGLLLALFRSFELFFPMPLLGQFFVILDEGDDAAVGLLMPSYVKVVYEPVSVIRTPFGRVHGVGSSHNGQFNSQLSNFFVDKYGSSEFIGILDADVVFRTGEVESLLFRDGKPIMFCTQHRDLGMNAVRRLGPEFEYLNPFSCMESFPFVIRRDLLPKLRTFVAQRMAVDEPRAALVALIEQSAHVMDFGNFALMGAYAHVFEHERYHFVIGGAGPLSTCPELRPCIHVHFSGPHWRQHENQKIHPEYFDTARVAMARGACHLACNRTEACTALIAQDPFDEELLSLEGAHELMFGGLYSLKLPDCFNHTVRRIKKHRKALRRHACASRQVMESNYAA